MNIFETASRQKIRLDSDRGLVTVEQLWDMPLTSKSGFDLDTMAKMASRNLKEAGEESFVATAPNPARASLELKLELVKHVIAAKLEENQARVNAASKAAERERLTELLGKKQDAKLESLTEDEIKARIAAL